MAEFSARVAISLAVGSEPPSPPPPTWAAAGAAIKQGSSAGKRRSAFVLSLFRSSTAQPPRTYPRKPARSGPQGSGRRWVGRSRDLHLGAVVGLVVLI